jgi:hypothetical protein
MRSGCALLLLAFLSASRDAEEPRGDAALVREQGWLATRLSIGANSPTTGWWIPEGRMRTGTTTTTSQELLGQPVGARRTATLFSESIRRVPARLGRRHQIDPAFEVRSGSRFGFCISSWAALAAPLPT